jgi:ethanolamine utilization protein EutP (predicted NTPase)
VFQTAFQPTAFQNDAFQIVITPIGHLGLGGDDAPYTKEELKRLKVIQKKLRQAEEKRIAALKADQELRKKTIADLVDPKPVAKKQQTKVQSNQEVSVDIPSNLANIDRYIANLVTQQQDLQNAVLIRAAKLRLEQELAVLEAKRQAELDDEEALLALLL